MNTTLISNDGKRIDCFRINNAYFASSVWTREEAEEYVKTGEYPQRLLDLIKQKYDSNKQ